MGDVVTPRGAASSCMVVSCLTLRKAVGILSIALPLVLVVGKRLLDGPGIQSSISAYYYTGMRDIFVGTLCATGVLLFSYRGYDRIDRLVANLAGVFVVGLALFPTASATGGSTAQSIVGHIHLTFASAYFLAQAYFSLVLFTKTDPARQMTARKKRRNVVYTACGCTIVVCLALVLVDFAFLEHSAVQALDPVFWLEVVAVFAFGISWLTKGEAILADVEAPKSASQPGGRMSNKGIEQNARR